MKRRSFLCLAGAVGVTGCLFGSSEDDNPGGANGTGNAGGDVAPAGVGEWPTLDGITTGQDRLTGITTSSLLIDELSGAVTGDVVQVSATAHLNLKDRWEITVPADVTLDGGRGNGAPGALLESPDGDETPVDRPLLRKIKLESGARLTGFRLRGRFREYVNPKEEHDGDFYAHRGGSGVQVGSGGEVDNNEIYGWPYAAVLARGNAHIHNNYIHHNAWEGLGYGVAIPPGNHMPLIESNYFNYNRHSITGAGGAKVGFHARYNVVGPEWVGSQFDMHGTEGMEGIAGEEIIIQRNTFQATRAVEEKTRRPGGAFPAIDIRGTPTEGVWVERNWFYHRSKADAFRQPDGPERAHFEANHYGPSYPQSIHVGAPQTVSILAREQPVFPPGSKRSEDSPGDE